MLSGLQRRPERREEAKNHLPCWESNPLLQGIAASSPITIPTELGLPLFLGNKAGNVIFFVREDDSPYSLCMTEGLLECITDKHINF